MGIMDGNQKQEPMHYGEIYSVWQYSATAKGLVSCFELFKNHAGDGDLKKLLQEGINQAKQEIAECDTLLTNNGTTPAPSLPARPNVTLDDIPDGARFTDVEIAVHFAADISAGLLACSGVLGLAIREDIGAMFLKYHTTKANLGEKLLRLSKDKGWVITPPLQSKTPEPVGV